MLDKKNFYINGEWIKPNSHEEITVIEPATEEKCAVITLGNKIDIDMAVEQQKMHMNHGPSHLRKIELDYLKNYTKITKKDGRILQKP